MLLDPNDTPWPHQFTKNGNGYEIGEGIYAQTYICVHCLQEYVKGFEIPEWITEPCPARETKKELKRIKNGGF